MVMLLNIIFLVVILRLSFENKVTAILMNKRWPGLITMQQLLFWVGFIALNTYLYLQLFGTQQGIYRLLFMLMINIPLYYLCYSKLVPEYYETKKYAEYIRYTAIVFVISCLIRILVEPEITPAGAVPINQEYFLLLVYLTQTAIIVVSSLSGISKYKLIVENELAKLEILKQQADLDLVKSKINPHFLLNTLNNIYSRSYSHDKVSANLIMQLSLLLQYTTYEIGKKRITIEKEIQMITALSSIYQLKYNKKLAITFDYAADELLSEIEIPPTIYFTLFENALKYSAIGIDEQAYIHATFRLNDNNIDFSIRNKRSVLQHKNTVEAATRSSIQQHAERSAGMTDKKQLIPNEDYTGIGTAVLKQMMDIEYGTAYQFETTESSGEYFTRLTINI
jgi:two-component system LytT family sensor kinase